MSKLIIISAPSGTGKSTIINYLQKNAKDLRLRFSISATSREPRGEERHAVEYYFMSEEEFKKGIEEGKFVEYEEVYKGRFYGTLKSEVQRIFSEGDNVIFDVDCEGGVNIKKLYKDKALSIFILPPSLDALRSRLESRDTDSAEMIEQRLAKAEKEMLRAKDFDFSIVNDNLEVCGKEITRKIRAFLSE